MKSKFNRVETTTCLPGHDVARLVFVGIPVLRVAAYGSFRPLWLVSVLCLDGMHAAGICIRYTQGGISGLVNGSFLLLCGIICAFASLIFCLP